MKKILVIGGALPQKEKVPYDNTMMYMWLERACMSQEDALEMIEWEAVYGKCQGLECVGHRESYQKEMQGHWDNVLRKKVIESDKVWIIGRVASEWMFNKNELVGKNVLFTMHPSKRNWKAYKADEIAIVSNIAGFLQN